MSTLAIQAGLIAGAIYAIFLVVYVRRLIKDPDSH